MGIHEYMSRLVMTASLVTAMESPLALTCQGQRSSITPKPKANSARLLGASIPPSAELMMIYSSNHIQQPTGCCLLALQTEGG